MLVKCIGHLHITAELESHWLNCLLLSSAVTEPTTIAPVYVCPCVC